MGAGAQAGAAWPGAALPVQYQVPDWVRVRQESFGLLFYDVRSTRLTFVRSGDSLAAPAFAGPRRVLRVGPLDGARRAAVSRLLQYLAAKGLIVVDESD